MVDARIERKHPINDVDEIISIVSSLRFYKFAFPKRDNPSFPQEWNEMDGYGWSWSGRGHVACDRFSRFLHAWEGWRSEKANVMARGS